MTEDSAMKARVKTCLGLVASLVVGATMSGCFVSKKETVEKPVEKDRVVVERPVEREHIVVSHPVVEEKTVIHERTYP